MKFKIKVVTTKNGQQSFFLYQKGLFFWTSVYNTTDYLLSDSNKFSSRADVLRTIDEVYGQTIESIEYEHLTKL